MAPHRLLPGVVSFVIHLHWAGIPLLLGFGIALSPNLYHHNDNYIQ